jgi:predicted nucleic acid-binding protein
VAFVLDASVAVAWATREGDARADLAWGRAGTEGAAVPALWWFELRNALVVNERRGRLTERQTTRFIRSIARFSISVDSSPDEARVMALARKHRLTVYDAAYLELAARERLPLATLDRALVEAARAEGVTLLSDASA